MPIVTNPTTVTAEWLRSYGYVPLGGRPTFGRISNGGAERDRGFPRCDAVQRGEDFVPHQLHVRRVRGVVDVDQAAEHSALREPLDQVLHGRIITRDEHGIGPVQRGDRYASAERAERFFGGGLWKHEIVSNAGLGLHGAI